MLIIKSHRTAQLLKSLETALQELKDVSVQSRQIEPLVQNFRYDAVLEIEVSGRPATLLIQTKNSVFPRDVRESIWPVRGVASHFPRSVTSGQVIPVIAALSISDSAI